jgi:CHAT domain-containing protein/tetratricopeptide (TPR) repeat protein
VDENRAQAYANLIQQLLSCPNGEEPQILQDNSELLDAEFLMVCEVIADNLAGEGQENAADFLRNLARQLGQLFGMNDEADTDNSEGENPQEYVKFIRELLQAEKDSKSDIAVIHPMLEQRQYLLNAHFAEILQQVAQNLIAQHPEAIESIIRDIENFSNHISQFSLGKRANNIEIAIRGYQIVLSNRELGSQKWAQTQNNLATAYYSRIREDKAENIELAIASYTAALTVYTREAFPEKWAQTQNNLAAAYRDRIREDKAENIEIAIRFYTTVLEVYTRQAFAEKWAGTQNNLANAYRDRIREEKAENIEIAIAFYNAALEVYKPEVFPEKWATTQNNLGLAYRNRIREEKAENIEIAIAFYNAALKVYKPEAFPEKWAGTQNNLAIAYWDRIREEKAENIEIAIAYYTASLEVYKPEAFPEKWAMTQNNLAIAYWDRIREEKAENIEIAIASFTASLEVYKPEAFPEKWATIQNNLATAYYSRIREDKAENIKRAIELYHNALTIRTREAFPQNHTESLSNLGTLYRSNQQWQLAYDTYAPAIETVEFLRGEIHSGDETKQKLAEEWNKLYLGMVEVCIELQQYTEAVEFAERSKGQNLIELLSVKDLYPKGEIPDEVRQELQQLRLRIAEENQRLKQAEEKNYDLINQLRQDLAAKYPYTPLKFGEIKQLADEKTAIVEWYILGRSFCAFIITNNDSTPQFLSFPESDLKLLINWGNEYLGDYDRNREQWQNSLETKLASLAQILHIDEIVNAIPKTCDKLILIPHRYLHLFPLHALPVSGENWQRFHSDNETCPLNSYLIDCFERGVSYAPSCQLLHQVQKYKRGKFNKLFAIQNPKDNLIAADIAVESIKNIFPNPEILAKKDAKKGKQGEKSEETLDIAERVANSHHLFFSCHGSFDQENPLQSGLELADGTLTLEEILRHFNLSECSLVTLSACETGQVQLDNSDEYISLTSGFLLAGSPSLYVSLWSVNALSTAILLIKTYENLYHQPGKLALALNQAQIWMRDTEIQGFLDWTKQCRLLDTNQDGLKKLQRNLNKQSKTQGTHAKIYQNPYHWAGFCAAGKGEQNMTNSIRKLEIFQQIIQESGLFVNLRDALVSLKEQFTDNDESNVTIIEDWIDKLPEDDKENILEEYEDRQLNVEMLGRGGTSPIKPGETSKILKEIIENATVAAEKTPEKDPNSSP